MPGMNGFELLDRISADASLDPVPAIVLTSAILTAGERQPASPGGSHHVKIRPVRDDAQQTPSRRSLPERSWRRYERRIEPDPDRR